MHHCSGMSRRRPHVARATSILLGAVLATGLLTGLPRRAHAEKPHTVTNFLVWFDIDDDALRPGEEANIFNTQAVELHAKISRDGGRTFSDVSCDPNLSAVALGAGTVEVGGTGADCDNELEYEPDEADIGKDVHIYVHFYDWVNKTTWTGTLHLKVHGEP